MSKIESTINCLSEIEDELTTEQYNKVYMIIQAAKRQAIEATLEVAAKKAKIGSLKYVNDNWEEVQLLSSIQCSSGCFSVSKASILELNDSDELKVI